MWLSSDNPALPHHRIARDIKQLYECLTGIDTGFIFSSLGLVSSDDLAFVSILSLFSVEQIWSLLEETIFDTMSKEVTVCLCAFDCVVVTVEVCLDSKYGFGGVSEDGRP